MRGAPFSRKLGQHVPEVPKQRGRPGPTPGSEPGPPPRPQLLPRPRVRGTQPWPLRAPQGSSWTRGASWGLTHLPSSWWSPRSSSRGCWTLVSLFRRRRVKRQRWGQREEVTRTPDAPRAPAGHPTPRHPRHADTPSTAATRTRPDLPGTHTGADTRTPAPRVPRPQTHTSPRPCPSLSPNDFHKNRSEARV